jgi:hypothetical protein
VAEAWDDGEVQADVEDGAADGVAASLAFEILQAGHVEFGIVPAGGAGEARAFGCGNGGLGGGLPGRGVDWCGLYLGRGNAGCGEFDVGAGGGAGEQHAFQSGGAQEAAVQVGEDGGDFGGAEAGGDRPEVGGGGALVDGVDEVAAVGEEDADGMEEDGDVVGHSGGGAILCGIWRGGDGCFVGGLDHVCIDNMGANGEARIFSYEWEGVHSIHA